MERKVEDVAAIAAALCDIPLASGAHTEAQGEYCALEAVAKVTTEAQRQPTQCPGIFGGSGARMERCVTDGRRTRKAFAPGASAVCGSQQKQARGEPPWLHGD